MVSTFVKTEAAKSHKEGKVALLELTETILIWKEYKKIQQLNPKKINGLAKKKNSL